MKNPWIQHGSKVILENQWWKIIQDKVTRPDGQPGEYNIVETPGSITVVALTDEQEVILIDQFRYITSSNSLEAPGGGMDSDDPLAEAKRELREETGISAKKWTGLGTIQPLNGLVRETMYLFLAQDLDLSQEAPEKAEAIAKVLHVPFPDVIEQIKNGTIDDGPTIFAVFKAALYLELLK